MPAPPAMKVFATIPHTRMKSLVERCDLCSMPAILGLGENKELSAIVAAVNPLDPFKPRIAAFTREEFYFPEHLRIARNLLLKYRKPDGKRAIHFK